MTSGRSIKRIVFESTSRFNGKEFLTLPASDIKQIAGRAGRYRTAADDIAKTSQTNSSNDGHAKVQLSMSPTKNLGLVTTLEQMDLPIVQRAMATEAGPITSAGLFPPDNILLRFSTYFPPDTPLSYMLLRLHEISRMHPRFHLCSLKTHVDVADVLQHLKGLTTADRLVFCAAPVALRDEQGPEICIAYARCVSNQGQGGLLDIPEVRLDILDVKTSLNPLHLKDLESLHQALVLYLWLSYRFTGIFTSQAMAFHVKALVETKIDEILTSFAETKKDKASIRKLRERVILRAFRDEFKLGVVRPTLQSTGKDVDNARLAPFPPMSPQAAIAPLICHNG